MAAKDNGGNELDGDELGAAEDATKDEDRVEVGVKPPRRGYVITEFSGAFTSGPSSVSEKAVVDLDDIRAAIRAKSEKVSS